MKTYLDRYREIGLRCPEPSCGEIRSGALWEIVRVTDGEPREIRCPVCGSDVDLTRHPIYALYPLGKDGE